MTLGGDPDPIGGGRGTPDRKGPGTIAIAAMILLSCTLAACSSGPERVAQPVTTTRRSGPAGVAYVFAYFTGDGKGGVRLAVSRDGIRFGNVDQGRPVLRAPSLGVGFHRDPSLLRTASGRWYLAWTTGARRRVALASSADLRHWSRPRSIGVMEQEPTAVNSWAPELLADPDGGYVMIFASTVRRLHPSGNSEPGVDGKPLNHRLYITHSDDLRTWSRSKLFWDRDLNAIDATVVATGDKDPARRFAVVYKDERLDPLRKNFRIAFGPGFDGPWAEPDHAIPEVGQIAEGPSLARSPDDKGWFLYADRYAEGFYALASSPDLRTWTTRTDDLRMPDGARHGTVLRVPAAAIANLLDDAPG